MAEYISEREMRLIRRNMGNDMDGTEIESKLENRTKQTLNYASSDDDYENNASVFERKECDTKRSKMNKLKELQHQRDELLRIRAQRNERKATVREEEGDRYGIN